MALHVHEGHACPRPRTRFRPRPRLGGTAAGKSRSGQPPYFHPEFARIIASVRDDVEVAVIEHGGKVTAFFPFQRESKTVGRAVGHPLSDYHGIICAPNLDFDPLALLRACKLVAWDFDHVLVSQTPFQPFLQFSETSPIIDLSGGFDRYVAERKKSGSGFRIPFQLMRKLEREVGPFTWTSARHIRRLNCQS